MFTIEQIEQAHSRVKSGADFPKYIKEIKEFGVLSFETWVTDSHTVYFGSNKFSNQSKPKYAELVIADDSNKNTFIKLLEKHQAGETDYFQFCEDCAATGIEKWEVKLNEMTCTYFAKNGDEILVEKIPE